MRGSFLPPILLAIVVVPPAPALQYRFSGLPITLQNGSISFRHGDDTDMDPLAEIRVESPVNASVMQEWAQAITRNGVLIFDSTIVVATIAAISCLRQHRSVSLAKGEAVSSGVL